MCCAPGSAGVAAVRQRRTFVGIGMKFSHFVTAVYNISMAMHMMITDVADEKEWIEKVLAKPYKIP